MNQKGSSKSSLSQLLLPNYSHIYLEEGAKEYQMTELILSRFPKAKIVPIDSYKEVFNPYTQDWLKQKKSPKLILAKKQDNFLYEGSDIAQNFGYSNFYYNTLILNCLYDCHYCYLQGLYPSANTVVFVNLDDFFEATKKKLQEESPIYLCISYDTDLLGFNELFPYAEKWLQFASDKPELIIELRTKSANYKPLQRNTPSNNVILAWTISPDTVVSRFEPKTPSLKARLKALKIAHEKGWRVRICLDPLLDINGWKEEYSELLTTLNSAVPLSELDSFSVGSFRMNTQFLKRIRSRGRPSEVLSYPYTAKDGISQYNQETESQLVDLVSSTLQSNGVSKDKIELIAA